MDFFNKLGDSIQNVGKEASKKAKDLSGTLQMVQFLNVKFMYLPIMVKTGLWQEKQKAKPHGIM